MTYTATWSNESTPLFDIKSLFPFKLGKSTINRGYTNWESSETQENMIDDGNLEKFTGTVIPSEFKAVSNTENAIIRLDDPYYEKIADRLYSYLSLKVGWDGDDGVPPKSDVIESCINLMHRIYYLTGNLPKPMNSSTGEVCLYWKSPTTYIEVSFNNEHEFSYFIEKNGTFTGYDNIPAYIPDKNEDLPEHLIKSIGSISNSNLS